MRSAWTDERLDDLADAIRPLEPRLMSLEGRVGALDARVGALDVRVGALDVRVGALEDRTAGVEHEVRELRTDMKDGFAAVRVEARADTAQLRQDLSAFQRQVTQIGYSLVVALIGAIVALTIALA